MVTVVLHAAGKLCMINVPGGECVSVADADCTGVDGVAVLSSGEVEIAGL